MPAPFRMHSAMSTSNSCTRIVDVPLAQSSALILKAWERNYRHWSDYARDDTFHQAAYREIEREIRTLASPSKKVALIDLGCGTGDFLRHLQKSKLWTGLAGIDHCRQAIDRARNADIAGFPRIVYHIADLSSPVANIVLSGIRSNHIAISVFLLDEMPFLERFFRVAGNLVLPGGHLICAMLDEACERERHDFAEQNGHNAAEPVVLQTVKRDEFGGELLYYRIVRPRNDPAEQAARAGWCLLSDRTFRSDDLKSRVGPALRLLVFRQREKT